MIVGIDVSAIPAEPRGAGRYVFELVRALAARGSVDLKLETRRKDGERWRALAPDAEIAPVVPDSRPRRLAWEQLVAPRFVDRWGVSVLHAPHYTMPEVAKVPKVVTIHDLTFFDHPQFHEKVKVSFFTRAIRVAAKRADAIVCVSDATARRLRELLEPAAPVHAIPHGIDHGRFRPDDPDGVDRELLAGLGVDADQWPFVLFVGTLEPRKNATGLVEAFDQVAPAMTDLRLVVAGGTGWSNDRFERAVAESPHRDRIVQTGYVHDEALPALMRNAKAVVYPAFDEGFGLPVLEALACGTTAITTTGSVMDEIAEGAALTARAGDVDALASMLAEVASSAPDAERVERGLSVARRYTWDATAAAHESVYRATAG